jgi:hypothetical protein
VRQRIDLLIPLLPLVLANVGTAGATIQDAPTDVRVAATAPACNGSDGYAAAPDGRRTFFLRPDILASLKQRRNSDPAVAAAYRSLIARADKALAAGPWSVVDKKVVPPSGNKHDYLSLAPYWWPDPAKPDGVPYVRRDGEVNPARSTDRFDLSRLQAMSSNVETLALAYYYSDDANYADRAALLLRAWFVDPTTAMNPNMNYAQAIPGREDGRAEGVLDTSRLQRVVDAIGLIAPSDKLSMADQGTIERWFGKYIDWMRGSTNGRGENAAKNNHGMWFDSQITQFALFARRPDVAKDVASAFAKKRIATQFLPDGRLPAELERTRSLHYTVFALIPAYDVADLGRCVGVDLWSYRDKDGRGLRSASDFLARYAPDISRWPYKELRPDANELDDLLMRAGQAWPDAKYSRAGQGDPSLRRYLKAGNGESDETIR